MSSAGSKGIGQTVKSYHQDTSTDSAEPAPFRRSGASEQRQLSSEVGLNVWVVVVNVEGTDSTAPEHRVP